MGIQQDAGELLAFIYRKYAEGCTSIGPIEVIQETQWHPGRINRAIAYLKDCGLLKIQPFLGNTNGVDNFYIHGLTPAGINIIENEPEFTKTFGFKINLGLVEFSWQKVKKEKEKKKN